MSDTAMTVHSLLQRQAMPQCVFGTQTSKWIFCRIATDGVSCERVTGFRDHAYACWSVDIHHTNGFLVSGGMDATVKLWDVQTAKCRHTLRQHTDSVNCVRFQVGIHYP